MKKFGICSERLISYKTNQRDERLWSISPLTGAFLFSYIYAMKSMLSTIIIGVIAFFAPVVPVLLAVGAFIMLNTLTGILKSAKLSGWSSIRSKKLARIASKVLVYNAAVLSFFIIDGAIFNDVLFGALGVSYALTKLMGIVLCSAELKSIDENFEAIYGVGLWETFGKIIRKAKSIAQSIQEIKKA